MIRSEGGGVLILVALIFPLLLTVAGVVIDLGRLYTVQSKAQSALDAAILGAVATASQTNVTTETRRIFNANYPRNYMNSSVTGPSVSRSGTTYTATAQVRVPWSIMQMFGVAQATLSIRSRVSRSQVGEVMELAMVIDNSNTINLSGVRNASANFITDLFGGGSLPNTYVSVIPFDVAVNVGSTPVTRLSWPQDAVQFGLLIGAVGDGFLANRNPDIPPDVNFIDISDAPPAPALTSRFRTPYGFSPGTFNNGDFVNTNLRRMLFGSSVRNDIVNSLNAMRNAGRTRINVGLLWGWLSLSPRWQGLWDPARPGLPLAASSARSKTLLLIVGSRNNVYLGGTQACGPLTCAVSNDDLTMQYLCSAIKGQGINIHAIGYGPATNYDATALEACSSGQGYFHTAINQSELNDVFLQINDNLKYSSIRLSQ